MPRLTRIYTRTGERVSKTTARIVAYGTIDELNAQIGVVLALEPVRELADPLRQIQNELLHAGAELCRRDSDRAKAPGPRIDAHHVSDLERLIDQLNEPLAPLKNFVLPGGHPVAAHLHVARTICRRAERDTIRLAAEELIGEHVIPYLNRLSDLLFVMARYQNRAAGVDEPLWDSRA